MWPPRILTSNVHAAQWPMFITTPDVLPTEWPRVILAADVSAAEWPMQNAHFTYYTAESRSACSQEVSLENKCSISQFCDFKCVVVALSRFVVAGFYLIFIYTYICIPIHTIIAIAPWIA